MQTPPGSAAYSALIKIPHVPGFVAFWREFVDDDIRDECGPLLPDGMSLSNEAVTFLAQALNEYGSELSHELYKIVGKNNGTYVAGMTRMASMQMELNRVRLINRMQSATI